MGVSLTLARKRVFSARRILLRMEPDSGWQFERNRWRERAAVILLIALAASVCGGIWWYRYTSTPEYSLSELGEAVREKNYGRARRYVDEERIAQAISQSLTDVLVAKYTKKFQDDPLPFTETRIEWLNKLAPKFHDWTLIGVRNAYSSVVERKRHTYRHVGLQPARHSQFLAACMSCGPR